MRERESAILHHPDARSDRVICSYSEDNFWLFDFQSVTLVISLLYVIARQVQKSDTARDGK